MKTVLGAAGGVRRCDAVETIRKNGRDVEMSSRKFCVWCYEVGSLGTTVGRRPSFFFLVLVFADRGRCRHGTQKFFFQTTSYGGLFFFPSPCCDGVARHLRGSAKYRKGGWNANPDVDTGVCAEVW
jgi:hypothetical protein